MVRISSSKRRAATTATGSTASAKPPTATQLTLNLYARSLGMGLRGSNPAITIKLVPSN